MAKPLLVLGCVLLVASGQPSSPSAKGPGVPAVFAPGVISTGGYESHPAFTPDGRTLYFVKSTPSFSFWTICVSRLVNGRWTAPEVAPFSGQFADADPFRSRHVRRDVPSDRRRYVGFRLRPRPPRQSRRPRDRPENPLNPEPLEPSILFFLIFIETL